jgi:serine/threonine protein kinase
MANNLKNLEPRDIKMPQLFNFNFGQSVESQSLAYYRGLQLLGRGKNADVYLVVATSERDRGNFFALKILQDASDEAKRRAFEHERDLLLTLDHPSVMKIVDQGVFQTRAARWPFYVCEYYATTLEAVIQRGCPLPQKLAYALQLCSALGYLSEPPRQLIHCDVKPGNILVDGLTCVLADFGMVRNGPVPGLTGIGPSLHTYRSPDIVESINHHTALTPKSDVFLLGLTLAHLFTGKNPCRPAVNGADPVVLDPIDEIPGAFGERIHSTINWMLSLEPNPRPEASFLINVWQGILFDAADRLRRVDPRVF